MRNSLPPETDLSTDELFQRVLRDLGADDERLDALVALHDRPTRAVVDRCLALCSGELAYERTVGLRVLREIGHPLVDQDLLWGPIEPTVIAIARTDEDADVVRWAVSCLGHQSSSAEALERVLDHVDHPDERVRFAVAAALPHFATDASPPAAVVRALLALAEDADANVRSYAIMGLVGDLDLARSIESTLLAHRTDPDEQIRRYCAEALAEIARP